MQLSAADARHILRRAGFGGTQAEVDHFTGRDMNDVVDEIVSVQPPVPSRPAAFSNGDLDDWQIGQRAIAVWMNRMGTARWVDRVGNTPSPLLEKLTVFWHGHFATSYEKVEGAHTMWEQVETYWEHGLGDFETLVRDISLGGAMLMYLDNEFNVKGGVQENFARELMELFTMGIGNYNEKDVVAMARAWTGHSVLGWDEETESYDTTYVFRADEHDNGPKTIFGITKNWDGPETVTEIVHGSKQWPTAQFITRKLWAFFVGDNPPAAAIDDVAGAFVDSGMQVRELLRALFTRPEFWAETNRWALVKSPLEYVITFFKHTHISVDELEGVGYQMAHMGQELWYPPNVAGWKTNGYWISTATLWGRGSLVSNRRWNLVDSHGVFDGIYDMSKSEAIDLVLSQFDLVDVSPATLDALDNWFTKTKAEHEWALPYSGMSLAALSPEFQVV